jgi:hypothetical protein
MIRFDLVGRLDGVARTPQGGIRATANLTRVGVFTYYNEDGSTSRELRHPDEIFAPDALASLRGAPLTIGHPGMVTPENWKQLAVGHVADDVRADGRFVKATIFIQDAKACADIESGALVEVSCGYEADVVPAEGEFEGERFDAKQIGHKYNHLALGAKNWGRAGSDVRVYLDSRSDASDIRCNSEPVQDASQAPEDSAVGAYAAPMTVKTDDSADLKKRTDALASDLERTTGERDAARADLDAATKKVAALETEIAALKASTVKADEVDARVAARLALETDARVLLGADSSIKGSDREVMTAALAKHDASFKSDGRSDDYLRARFDAAVENARRADKAAADLNAASVSAPTSDAANPSRYDAALDAAAKARAEASKGGPPPGSLVRSS